MMANLHCRTVFMPSGISIEPYNAQCALKAVATRSSPARNVIDGCRTWPQQTICRVSLSLPDEPFAGRTEESSLDLKTGSHARRLSELLICCQKIPKFNEAVEAQHCLLLHILRWCICSERTLPKRSNRVRSPDPDLSFGQSWSLY